MTYLLSLAPMIDWTNMPFRVFVRLLAPKTLLYTEMQTIGAIQHNSGRALLFDSVEHPVAIQLGGADPKGLAHCARHAQQVGFDEININLGCPSDKVQSGQFGACLMAKPKQVVACIQAMKDAVDIPVTAKIRIGIDNQDDYPFFSAFAHSLVEAGADKLIVHARKAWLTGLNPKQNRTIPPLHYDYVYALKKDLPHTPIVINGNIKDIDAVKEHLKYTNGVMCGRLLCDNPYAFAQLHQQLYPEIELPSREEIIANYLQYTTSDSFSQFSLSIILKPLFNLYHGCQGAKQWKYKLMEIIKTKNHNVDSLLSHSKQVTCRNNLRHVGDAD